jgi:hypothetical protein
MPLPRALKRVEVFKESGSRFSDINTELGDKTKNGWERRKVKMMKHMDDGAELNMIVDDNGNLLASCSKCRKVWTGSLTPVESPLTTKRMELLIRATAMKNPAVLEDIGRAEAACCS